MATVRNVVKSADHQIKEYVKKISEDDLRWLAIRFKERMGGDLADALGFIQDNYNELNRLLSNAPNADSVYDVADLIDRNLQEEIKRRSNFRPTKEVKEVK